MSGITIGGVADQVGRYLTGKGVPTRPSVVALVVDAERRGIASVTVRAPVAAGSVVRARQLIDDLDRLHRRGLEPQLLNFAEIARTNIELWADNRAAATLDVFRAGLNARTLTPPIDPNELATDSPGDRGRPAETAPGAQPARSFDLAIPYSVGGWFGDVYADLIPDRTETAIVVGSGSDALSAAHVAARLGLETTGITLPLARTDQEVRDPTREPNPILVGRGNRLVDDLVKIGRADLSDLRPGEGVVQVAPRAFGTLTATVVAGADDAGTEAASRYLARHVPYVWDIRRGALSFSDAKIEVARFLGARSGAGQAAQALGELDSIVRDLTSRDGSAPAVESLDVKLFLESGDAALDAFLTAHLARALSAAKVTVKSEAITAPTPVIDETLATYVQDDWQLGRRVTLNLGLRYDVQFGSYNEDLDDLLGRIGEELGPQFATYPLPIPFHEGADARGDRNNLGPRVGLAWDATGDGRTNVHAGYGLFYDNMRTLQNFPELTWPQSRQIIINNPSFPDPLLGRSRDEFVSTAPPNITVMDNDNVSAYAHQFSVGVSRMVGRDFGINADVIVVERKSDRDTVDLNLPDPVTRVRPYPQFARVNYWQPTADNRYTALLLKFERRFSGRYQYLASYTLSTSEDDSFQNVYGDRYGFFKETYPGVADRRHRLVMSGTVRLPWDLQLAAIGNFYSSLPVNPTSGIDINTDGYAIDIPGGVTRFSMCRDLNLAAINGFRQGRNLAAVADVACPGFANVDLRFTKTFLMQQSGELELIAQLFNIANRANYNVANNNITAANFGQSTSLLPNINAPSRQVEFALRYRF